MRQGYPEIRHSPVNETRQGLTAPQVIGRAARAAGLIGVERPLAADEVGDLF